MAKKTTIRQKKIIDGHHDPEVHQVIDAKGNTIRLEAQFPLSVQENETGSWIVYSPHFKTFGYSTKDEQEATEDFRNAIDNFFAIHIERGTLESALLEFGWTKSNNTLQKPKLFNSPKQRLSTREFNLKQLKQPASA